MLERGEGGRDVFKKGPANYLSRTVSSTILPSHRGIENDIKLPGIKPDRWWEMKE